MPTLDLVTGANDDDLEISDLSNPSPMRFGAVGTSPLAGFGMAYSFPNCPLVGTETLTEAWLSLMKSSTPGFSQQIDYRMVAVDEDNRTTFTTSSPNRPGDPAIVSAQIAAGSISASRTSGTRYEFPPSTHTAQRATLAASLQAVIQRPGWAQNNSIAIVNQSDQDASAQLNFNRGDFHDHNSATADSEPHLFIVYTEPATGRLAVRMIRQVRGLVAPQQTGVR